MKKIINYLSDLLASLFFLWMILFQYISFLFDWLAGLCLDLGIKFSRTFTIDMKMKLKEMQELREED